MRITCQQHDLAQGLTIANHAVSSRSSQPILSKVLLAAEQSSLTLATTDLEIGITFRLDAEILEEGRIALPAKLLLDYIQSLPEGVIELYLPEDSTTIQITGVRSKASIRGTGPSEFPVLPTVERGGIPIPLESSLLKEMITQVAFAAAEDDSRPVLASVLTEIRDAQIAMVSADAFRLALRVVDLGNSGYLPGGPLIPAKTLTELGRILPVEGIVEMTVDPIRAQVLFHTENVDLVSRLVEGTFPAYERIIPQETTTRAVVKTKDFLAAVKSASLFARHSHTLRVRINPAESELGNSILTLEAVSEETGDTSSVIDASVEGPAIEMAFHAKYLSEALAAIHTDEVALETTTTARPGVLKPVGGPRQTYIVMPLHVTH